jgi:hypothetical protein
MRIFPLAAATLAMFAFAGGANAQWGDLSGQFVLSGEVPKEIVITPDKDVAVCGKHKIVDEWLVVGQKKGIKNIVVYLYLAEGAKAPAAHPDYEKAAKADVVLDNEKCRFEPRVALLRTSQKLVVGNKDPVGHNTKVETLENKPENPIVPAMASLPLSFPKTERLPTTVSCSIHPWMSARVLIRDNPYMAVTDADGKFTIKNLPAGKHTIQFWHESMGFLAKGLKKDGKPLAWSKGRTEVTITPKGVDLGKVEVDVAGFKKPGK